jgi:hypothetical protein
MPKRGITIEQTDLARRATVALESARAAKETFNNAAISFLLTELDAAITFCKVCRVALASSSNHARIERELDHVEHALASALRTKEQVLLKANKRKQFRGKVQQLQALVTLLAVRLPGPRIKGIEECLTRFTG